MDPPPTLDIFRPDAIGIATPAAMVTCIATPVAMATPAADPVALPVTPAGGAMQVIVYATPQDMPIVDGILLQPAQAVMDWGNVPVTMAVSVEEVSGSAWVPTPETLCIGDCLEVKDTHGLWATARVMATLVVPPHGPLILLHYEGWSTSWFMWVHPTHDAARIRPLRTCPGLGSRGEHTKAKFLEKLAWARTQLSAGASEWGLTGGKERTYPFRNQSTMRVQIADVAAWLEQQSRIQRVVDDTPDAGWLTCFELARDQELCGAMYAAVSRMGAQQQRCEPQR